MKSLATALEKKSVIKRWFFKIKIQYRNIDSINIRDIEDRQKKPTLGSNIKWALKFVIGMCQSQKKREQLLISLKYSSLDNNNVPIIKCQRNRRYHAILFAMKLLLVICTHYWRAELRHIKSSLSEVKARVFLCLVFVSLFAHKFGLLYIRWKHKCEMRNGHQFHKDIKTKFRHDLK